MLAVHEQGCHDHLVSDVVVLSFQRGASVSQLHAWNAQLQCCTYGEQHQFLIMRNS